MPAFAPAGQAAQIGRDTFIPIHKLGAEPIDFNTGAVSRTRNYIGEYVRSIRSDYSAEGLVQHTAVCVDGHMAILKEHQ